MRRRSEQIVLFVPQAPSALGILSEDRCYADKDVMGSVIEAPSAPLQRLQGALSVLTTTSRLTCYPTETQKLESTNGSWAIWWHSVSAFLLSHRLPRITDPSVQHDAILLVLSRL